MPKFVLDDTICAVATPAGEGGIGIVRLSGPAALDLARRFFRPPQPIREFASHRVYYGHIVDGENQVVDEVMLVWFKKPQSYTREDMVEISTHGGRRVLKSVLELLTAGGARMADPGEFTRRAFLNGRIDLTQAEAVLDLIKAKTRGAQDQALRQLQGGMKEEVQRLRQNLLRLCAHVEAYLDFPEDDIEVYSQPEFLSQADIIAAEVRRMLQGFQRGAILREGMLAVILGRPNVGKSSLLNALLDRDRAIVSDVPGTTRDLLEEELDIHGIPVRIVDTAGLRSDAGRVETIGISKARDVMRQAQLFLLVLDGSEGFTAEDEKIYQEICKENHIIVVNKSDLPVQLRSIETRLAGQSIHYLSALKRTGIRELEGLIYRHALNGSAAIESSVVTKVRHKEALEKVLSSLVSASKGFASRASLEFIALDLKQALDHLGEITGEIYTDDILDVIFREFCIGK